MERAKIGSMEVILIKVITFMGCLKVKAFTNGKVVVSMMENFGKE